MFKLDFLEIVKALFEDFYLFKQLLVLLLVWFVYLKQIAWFCKLFGWFSKATCLVF